MNYIHELIVLLKTSLEVTQKSESDYEVNINYLLLIVLLGKHEIYQLLRVCNMDRKLLIDTLYHKSSMGFDPYFVGHVPVLNSTIDP